MFDFRYALPKTYDEAGKILQGNEAAVAKAAGIDLLDLLKERIVEPPEVVNLLRLPRAGAKEGDIDGMTTLSQLASHAWVRENFPALAQAAAVAATPQIRNRATVAGNICQHTRCWYFRNKGFGCNRRGDDRCSALAKEGNNRYHAVFGNESCACAHPSNLAPALVALGAQIKCVKPGGERSVDAGVFFEKPQKGRMVDNALTRGELIRSIALEPTELSRNSAYAEFRERHTFDFALVSAVVAVDFKDDKIRDARVVLGALAPYPYRATKAEAVLKGARPGKAVFEKVAEAALEGATPLAHNRYKIPIAKAVIRRALEGLGS